MKMKQPIAGTISTKQCQLAVLASLPGVCIILSAFLVSEPKSTSLDEIIAVVGWFIGMAGLLPAIWFFKRINTEKEDHQIAYIVRWLTMRGTVLTFTKGLTPRVVYEVNKIISMSEAIPTQEKGALLEAFWKAIDAYEEGVTVDPNDDTVDRSGIV